MDLQSATPLIDQEWDIDTGFLGRLRSGVFDPDGAERFVHLLESVEVGDVPCLERRFVALTWFVPVFMDWQRERVQEQGGSVEKLDNAITRVITALFRVLGVP